MASEPKIRPIQQLTKGYSYKRDINEKVNEILSGIEDSIKDAHDNKQKNLIYNLPTAIDVPGISLQDAQKHVYYFIVKALNTANYKVNIQFIGKSAKDQQVKLHITWLTADVKMKENEMDAYLAKYTKT